MYGCLYKLNTTVGNGVTLLCLFREFAIIHIMDRTYLEIKIIFVSVIPCEFWLGLGSKKKEEEEEE